MCAVRNGIVQTSVVQTKRDPSGGGGDPKQKFNRMCNECRKVGHKSADCWTKNANADKHSKWHKKKLEHKKASIDSNKTTVMVLNTC